jgi:riboflavin synthase
MGVKKSVIVLSFRDFMMISGPMPLKSPIEIPTRTLWFFGLILIIFEDYNFTNLAKNNMFTGIIEAVGVIEKIEEKGSNINFTLSCPFTHELKIDQSLAHNGCCLTVVEISGSQYVVTAIDETLIKTNLGKWEVGSVVNLERCMMMNGRLDGHIVQGHVDHTGEIIDVENKDGSYFVTVQYNSEGGFVTVPQGSITVNGISLTVAKSGDFQFSVAIIPYTWEFTNMKNVKVGDKVNLEFDIVGKYIAKLINRQNGVE